MKNVENFDDVRDLGALKSGEVQLCSSGLYIQLTDQDDDTSRPLTLRKPSGVFESYATKNFTVAQAKEIFGKNELVVGSGQHLRISFLSSAKNFWFQYYQVADYTEEVAAFIGKPFKDLTADERSFEFKALYKQEEKIHLGVPDGFSEIKWGTYTASAFTSVIFINNLAGSLHLDQITWEDA